MKFVIFAKYFDCKGNYHVFKFSFAGILHRESSGVVFSVYPAAFSNFSGKRCLLRSHMSSEGFHANCCLLFKMSPWASGASLLCVISSTLSGEDAFSLCEVFLSANKKGSCAS